MVFLINVKLKYHIIKDSIGWAVKLINGVVNLDNVLFKEESK